MTSKHRGGLPVFRLLPLFLFLAPLSMGARDCERVDVGKCHGGSCQDGGSSGGVCRYDGERYAPGDRFPSEDGCNTCFCEPGGEVSCTLRACADDICGGLAGMPCDEGEFCDYPPDAQCGAADQTGTCAPIPDACTLELNPVCGCDDKTYENACRAASEGVSVAYKGECSDVTCDYNGQIYRPGDGFPADDGCNTCSCEPGGEVSCTLRACADDICGGLAGLPCDEGEFCDYPPDAQCGAADQAGTCEPIPDICTQELEPVCGCDDMTYNNACHAASEGVSVAYEGECSDVACNYNGQLYRPGEGFPADDGCNQCSCQQDGTVVCTLIACPDVCGGLAGLPCDEGEFCSYPPDAQCGAADQTGTCEPIPEACTDQYDPVCGCDGETHSNACYAAAAGTSVAYAGECNDSGGQVCGTRGVGPCPDSAFCDFPASANCGATDAPGICQPRPTNCDDVLQPVCGCDGITYENRCEANAEGVSVADDGPCGAAGACGGLLGLTCDSGQYCDYPPGAFCGFADATGVCEEIPEACTREFNPVCGCNGQTYDNPCLAAADGVSVASQGACDGGCEYAGLQYPAGASFPSEDGCNRCTCEAGGAVACTERACVRVCGGLAGVACADDQYCNYPPDALCGAADQTGTCAVIPEVCTLELNPVCGCDDRTYPNACAAAAEGVSVLHEGECE